MDEASLGSSQSHSIVIRLVPGNYVRENNEKPLRQFCEKDTDEFIDTLFDLWEGEPLVFAGISFLFITAKATLMRLRRLT
jgi:hypothetical protein